MAMREVWRPNVTVASVLERDGYFMLVEEETETGLRFNQPAGHLEANESLLDAVARETREETAHRFEAEYLVGVYLWPRPDGELTYLRFAFGGAVGEEIEGARLDDGIVRVVWMTADEIRACSTRHRSPLVMQCVDDWLAGRRFPLDVLRHYP